MIELAEELSAWFKMRCVDGVLPAGHVGMIMSGRTGVGKTAILNRAAQLAGVEIETFHPWSSASSGSFEHMVASSAMNLKPNPRILVVDHAEVWAGYGIREDGTSSSSSNRNTFAKWTALARKDRVKHCTIVFVCADLSISKLQKMAKDKKTPWKYVDVERETGRKGINYCTTSFNVFESFRSIVHLTPRPPSIIDAVAMSESDSRLQMVMWWNGIELIDPELWSYLDVKHPYSPWNAAHILTHIKAKQHKQSHHHHSTQTRFPETKYFAASKPKPVKGYLERDVMSKASAAAQDPRESLLEWWNQE